MDNTAGLPHAGFNRGPLATPMHLLGMWGLGDRTVPPLSNTDDPTKSLDTSSSSGGWYYGTARNTTDLWGVRNGCVGRASLNQSAYGMGAYSETLRECTEMQGCDGGAAVIECLFDGGHICNREFQFEPMLAFMESHSRIELPEGSGDDDGAKEWRQVAWSATIVVVVVAAAAILPLIWLSSRLRCRAVRWGKLKRGRRGEGRSFVQLTALGQTEVTAADASAVARRARGETPVVA